MKKIALFVVMMVVIAALAAHAADWDQKAVNEAIEKGKSGKRVDIRKTYPEDQINQVVFEVTGVTAYAIDVKARLCYYRWQITDIRGGSHAVAVTLVPCKNLKEGYPVMAPIIDWEK